MSATTMRYKMGTKEFEKKDWSKAAKAFAKQAYGKKKLEAIKRERRFDASKDEWDD